MQKNIIIKSDAEKETVEQLANSLGVSRVLANLMVQRDIKTFDEAKLFFRPDLNLLHDPFLMKDMHKAVARLEEALAKNQKILVYGDYDVDGTTSVALVYSFLKDKSQNIDFYIPDRYSEGYGISTQGIDFASQNGFNLIIALDCGIKAVEKVAYASQKGIDFIICDHHTPGDTIPSATAVLDPKRKDCNYPFKELSGCGVGFKFMQAFSRRNEIPAEELNKLIDLTAISIASDIVPVTGENRILAFHGLKKLNENPIIGLKAIMKIAGIDKKNLSISDCVFKIGPRINAAGRIKSGNSSVDLLISQNEKSAEEFGHKIDAYNTDRKNFDRNITHQAIRMIGNDMDLQNRKTTVLFNPEWHKGVVGIVASRLIETYYRPTVILTESRGKATGSARSVEGFNLYDAVEACSHLLENFGGHTYAAGLTMKIENVQKFADCFDNFVSSHITPDQLIPSVNVDTQIMFSEITPKFYKVLKQFAPFGPGNMSPVFITKNVKDTGNSQPVGQTREHMKLEMVDSEGTIFGGIAFSMAHQYSEIKKKNPFTVCYSIDENDFRGNISLQAVIKEIQFEE
jgi:single-stranded-DNA-specific exonuclease